MTYSNFVSPITSLSPHERTWIDGTDGLPRRPVRVPNPDGAILVPVSVRGREPLGGLRDPLRLIDVADRRDRLGQRIGQVVDALGVGTPGRTDAHADAPSAAR